VELVGLEPTTSSLRTRRSPKLSYSPKRADVQGNFISVRLTEPDVTRGSAHRSRFHFPPASRYSLCPVLLETLWPLIPELKAKSEVSVKTL
jgi:hypothetical protein